MPLSLIFNAANMSFNAIRENKILAKISGFTVLCQTKLKGDVEKRSLPGSNQQNQRCQIKLAVHGRRLLSLMITILGIPYLRLIETNFIVRFSFPFLK